VSIERDDPPFKDWYDGHTRRDESQYEDIEVRKTRDIWVKGRIVGDTKALGIEPPFGSLGNGYIIEEDNFTIPPTTIYIDKGSKIIRRKK